MNNEGWGQWFAPQFFISKTFKMNNNIQEDYCSFEVSKLLKEKGFTVECTHRYNTSFNGLEFEMADYTNDWNTNYLSKPYYLSAPTHSIAIKWLRENFGYSVYVKPLPYSETLTHYRWGYYSTMFSTRGLSRVDPNDYMTHEEATEAAILYILEKYISPIKQIQ